MIVEGLFVYFPTIIAITIAFFVGLSIGIFIVAGCCAGIGLVCWKIPTVRKLIESWFHSD